MKYECCLNDPDHFATALRKDSQTSRLTWDNSKGQDVIIVQTAFSVSASDILNEICNALNSNERPLTDYTDYFEVMNGVWVCYVTAADKARNNGCRLNGEASTYTVISCQADNGVCKIYQPKNQAMSSQSCSIPLEIHVTIQKETRTKGTIRRHEIETGFYSISFQGELAANYHNESLSIRVNDFEIPVTREMLEQGTVFIKSENKPVFISKNKGIKIV